mmetsp:Transcript_57708/g.134463  ORF Transcript_57708/g.134463 Transcript_57708/m.134463 type:complete len:84 (+) Transcript_57708:54-305(+)
MRTHVLWLVRNVVVMQLTCRIVQCFKRLQLLWQLPVPQLQTRSLGFALLPSTRRWAVQEISGSGGNQQGVKRAKSMWQSINRT